MEIGKINGKRKKKRVFSASWAGGISAQPSAGRRPSRPTNGEQSEVGAVGAGPLASEEGSRWR
jgi:hypothetical protein